MKTNKITIVKIGGSIVESPYIFENFIKNFVKIKEPKILVHGGGKIATELAKRLDIKTEMIEGRRVTSKEMLDITIMTYAGSINKKLVSSLQESNCNAFGMSGADGNLILARKRFPKPVDFGYVGDIIQINTSLIESIIDLDLVPVICSIAHNKSGQLLNCNADTIGSSIAIELSKYYEVSLIYCFEKEGVLDIDGNIIDAIDRKKYEQLKESGIIHSGMIPKIETAIDSKNQGVHQVVIKGVDNLLIDLGTYFYPPKYKKQP